jgi:hypothetical protein
LRCPIHMERVMRNLVIAAFIAGGFGLLGGSAASAAPVIGSGAQEVLPDITEQVQDWRFRRFDRRDRRFECRERRFDRRF